MHYDVCGLLVFFGHVGDLEMLNKIIHSLTLLQDSLTKLKNALGAKLVNTKPCLQFCLPLGLHV